MATKRTPCAILQASLLYCLLILSFGCASSMLGCRLSQIPNASAAEDSQYNKGCSWHTSAIFYFLMRLFTAAFAATQQGGRVVILSMVPWSLHPCSQGQ